MHSPTTRASVRLLKSRRHAPSWYEVLYLSRKVLFGDIFSRRSISPHRRSLHWTVIRHARREALLQPGSCVTRPASTLARVSKQNSLKLQLQLSYNYNFNRNCYHYTKRATATATTIPIRIKLLPRQLFPRAVKTTSF